MSENQSTEAQAVTSDLFVDSGLPDLSPIIDSPYWTTQELRDREVKLLARTLSRYTEWSDRQRADWLTSVSLRMTREVVSPALRVFGLVSCANKCYGVTSLRSARRHLRLASRAAVSNLPKTDEYVNDIVCVLGYTKKSIDCIRRKKYNLSAESLAAAAYADGFNTHKYRYARIPPILTCRIMREEAERVTKNRGKYERTL